MRGARKRKFHKYIMTVLIFFVLTVAWTVRFFSFQRVIRDIKTEIPLKKHEDIGQWVPFGDNYQLYSYCEDYWLKIDNVRILDAEEDKEELEILGYSGDALENRNLIIELEVTLKNQGNTDGGISFLSSWLLGEDFYTTLDVEQFEAINSLEQNSMGGVRLHTDSECKLRLPYPVSESAYRKKINRSIEKEQLWLWLTSYPEENWARVQ